MHKRESYKKCAPRADGQKDIRTKVQTDKLFSEALLRVQKSGQLKLHSSFSRFTVAIQFEYESIFFMFFSKSKCVCRSFT